MDAKKLAGLQSHRDRLRIGQGQILEEELEEDRNCEVLKIQDEREDSKNHLGPGHKNGSWVSEQEINSLAQQINRTNRYFGIEQGGHPSTYRNLAKNNKNFNAPHAPQTPTGQKNIVSSRTGTMKAYNHTRRFFSTVTNTAEFMSQIQTENLQKANPEKSLNKSQRYIQSNPAIYANNSNQITGNKTSKSQQGKQHIQNSKSQTQQNLANYVGKNIDTTILNKNKKKINSIVTSVGTNGKFLV